MSARDLAWTTAVATGIGCAALAASAAWLLLTQPLAVTGAVENGNTWALFQAAAAAIMQLVTAAIRLL